MRGMREKAAATGIAAEEARPSGKARFLCESNTRTRGFSAREGILLMVDYDDKLKDLRVED